MAGMGTGAWLVLWICLGGVAVFVGGVFAIRALGRCRRLVFPGSRWAGWPAGPPAEDAPPRPAHGQVSAEEDLREKVGLKA